MIEEELTQLARNLTVQINNMIDLAAKMQITVIVEPDYHQTVGGENHIKINLIKRLL